VRRFVGRTLLLACCAFAAFEVSLIMRIIRRAPWLFVTLGLALASLTAQAQEDDGIPGESYHWQAQVRALFLTPLNQHDPLNVNVGHAFQGELAGEWLFLPYWSTELTVASPAKLDLDGVPGAVRLWNQTLTVKYYFPTATVPGLHPYIGTGIYHSTASSDGTGPNIGFESPGFGWVLQGGVNYSFAPNAFASLDVRYLDNLQPTLLVDGSNSGHLGINPIVVGIGVGLRF
jgi:outer membrane protein